METAIQCDFLQKRMRCSHPQRVHGKIASTSKADVQALLPGEVVPMPVLKPIQPRQWWLLRQLAGGFQFTRKNDRS